MIFSLLHRLPPVLHVLYFRFLYLLILDIGHQLNASVDDRSTFVESVAKMQTGRLTMMPSSSSRKQWIVRRVELKSLMPHGPLLVQLRLWCVKASNPDFSMQQRSLLFSILDS